MSLVTRGIGGSSILVTAGMGRKDAITQIQEEEYGGAQHHKRDYSFLRYSFTLPMDSVQSVVEEFDDDDAGMSEAVSSFLSDKVLDIDGDEYKVIIEPDDIQRFVNKAADLDQKIKAVMREVDVTRKAAKRMLLDRAKLEVDRAITHTKEVFADDMDLLEILLLADEL